MMSANEAIYLKVKDLLSAYEGRPMTDKLIATMKAEIYATLRSYEAEVLPVATVTAGHMRGLADGIPLAPVPDEATLYIVRHECHARAMSHLRTIQLDIRPVGEWRWSGRHVDADEADTRLALLLSGESNHGATNACGW